MTTTPLTAATARQPITITDYEDRVLRKYEPGTEPYGKDDELKQKLWCVVAAEFGPNAADVLVKKLHQAVVDHVTNGGVRR